MATALDRARAAFSRGDDAATVREVEQALAEGGGDDALMLGANAALRAGDLPRGIGWLERLHQAHPQHPQFRRVLATAHNNLGSRAWQAGDLERASAAFARALTLEPDLPEALYNRARFALQARQPHRALADLDRLATARTLDPAAALLRAEVEIALGADDAPQRLLHALGPQGLAAADPARIASALADGGADAEALARAAAIPADRQPLPLLDLAQRLADNSAADAARQVYARVAEGCADGARVPGLFAALAARLVLPQSYASIADLEHARAGFTRGLAAIESKFDAPALSRCAPMLEQIAWSNQALAYQGRDDRELLARYGAFAVRAARTLAPGLPRMARRPPSGRPRIAFVSAAFRNATSGHYFAAWIATATAAGFDTTVVQLPPHTDAMTERIGATASRLLRPTGPLREVAAHLRELAFDLAVFPDPAVDARVFALAARRIAPRQAMAWGHPSTSGLPSIDAYVSCAPMEPVDAQRHYAERLHLLPGIGTRYAPPPLPPTLPREVLGLPSARCYFVPQAPMKLHPDGDPVLAAIAAQDAGGCIVLFRGEHPATARRIGERLGRALREAGADPARQLRWLPMTDRARYLATAAQCEVMVDVPHWSGGNTTIDALRVGLPVVARPGALMRGRQSLAMLEALGLGELACTDDAAQAALAVRIAREPEFRASLRARIADGLDALLSGDAAVAALPALLHRLVDDLDPHDD